MKTTLFFVCHWCLHCMRVPKHEGEHLRHLGLVPYLSRLLPVRRENGSKRLGLKMGVKFISTMIMTYDVATSVAPSVPATVDISIKAGVITRGGDVKPVARSEFIIFNDDIKPVLGTVNDREGKPLDVFGFYMADEYRLLDNGLAYTTALQKLKPIIVDTFTTDFEGNASIQVPRSDTPDYIYSS